MELMARRLAHLVEKIGGRRGVDGFVDRVLAGEVTGWAFDPKKPHRRVHIVARCDGKIVAEALADLPRKDLAQSGKGDGRHGFNLRLPANLFDGSARKVRVEIGGGPVRRLLKGGAITVAARRPAAAPPPPARPTPSHGVLESVAHGVLNGWAAHPRNGGTPAVVDVYDDERYLGSVTADRPRPGLREAGAPSGALGFQFRLPPTVDAAAIGRMRARIAGTRIDLRRADGFPGGGDDAIRVGEDGPAPAIPSHGPPPPAAERRPDSVRPARRQVALLIAGDADEAGMRRATKAWAAQNWPTLSIGAVSTGPGGEGEHRFGGDDEDRLRAFVGEAHTVVLARPGEDLDAALARAVSVGRPLCDVLTWERGPASRRDADRLAVLLGDTAAPLAVRGHAIAAYPGRLAAELAAGDTRALELWLAANPALRWGRLAGALSSGPAGRSTDLRRAEAPAAPARVTLAVWPEWSPASLESLAALAAAAPETCDLEALVPARAPVAEIEAALRQVGPERRLSVRPIDSPAGAGAGSWLRVFGEAAAGEVIVLCRAGVVLRPRPGALAEICGWARHPLAGAVTIEIASEDAAAPLAGLALRQARPGWTAVSAFAPSLKGRARPVLAAPGAFMAIDRARLAAAGGFDAERFPEDGADLDLCLRMRRTGHAALLLGDIEARADAGVPGLSSLPTALALLDVDELAAAADAYPAPPDKPA